MNRIRPLFGIAANFLLVIQSPSHNLPYRLDYSEQSNILLSENSLTSSQIKFKKMKLRLILFSFLLINTSIAFSQKPALDHSLYDDLLSVRARHISENGKWIGYNINPQEGDRELLDRK